MIRGAETTGDLARQRWVALALACLCAFLFSLVIYVIPPVLPLIMEDLNLSHAQAGLLMGLFGLPGIFISIPAGSGIDRYGVRRAGILSLVLTMLGMGLMATGGGFWVLALGRTIAGVGGIGLSVMAPQIVGQWFRQRQMGLAMGIFTASMPVAVILSMSLLSALGESLGWRASVGLSAVVSAATLVIFWQYYREAPANNERQNSERLGLILGLRQAGLPVWLIAMARGWSNAALIAFLTFAPTFLVQQGSNLNYAGSLTGLSLWGLLMLSVPLGYLIDRRGGKRLMVAVSGIASAALMFLTPSMVAQPVLLMLLIGIPVTLGYVATFALPSDFLAPERLGLGFGIFYTCANIGMVAGPFVAGLARDVTGSYQMSFAVMAVFFLISAVPMGFLRPRHIQKGR